MKINFPKIVRTVHLSEYAPELEGMEGGSFQVWVNPPIKFLQSLEELFRDEKKEDEYLAAIAELLSQGADKLTAAELKKMIEHTAETDPAFWMWMQNRIVQEITDHRLGLKKASAPPPPS